MTKHKTVKELNVIVDDLQEKVRKFEEFLNLTRLKYIEELINKNEDKMNSITDGIKKVSSGPVRILIMVKGNTKRMKQALKV